MLPIAPSPDRVPSLLCEHFPPCRGCPQIPVSYATQLASKRQQLIEALGTLVADESIVAATIPSPQLRGYRNQARLVFRRMSRGGHSRVGLGLYLPGTHRVVHIPNCPIQPERMNAIAYSVTRLAEDLGLTTYDERHGTGALRYLALRSDRARKHFLMTIIVGEDTGRPLRELAERVRARHPEVVGVGLHQNTSHSNVVFAGHDVWTLGADRLEDEVGRFRILVSPRSFLQVNHPQAEWIYSRIEASLAAPENVVSEAGAGPEIVLDLYCGIGGIGLHLARRDRVVVGIEESEEAIEDARRAAHRNEIQGVRFVKARVEDFLTDPAAHGFDLSTARIGAAVLNPPRSGVRAGVMQKLAALGPEVIAYVSCNPASLARDLQLLGSRYVLESATPIDMIPLTPHIEVLCFLRKA